MSALDSDIRDEVVDVLTSSITGFSSGAKSGNVFEYEVDPGLFLGVAPRDDDDSTIATLFIYVADLAQYSDNETPLESNPTITNLLYEVDAILTEAFEDTDIDTSHFPSSFDNLTEDGPGRYYAMDLPRETAPA